MELVLRAKLSEHPDLKSRLLATRPYDIIEDCSARANESGLFWGAALKDGVWVGENNLGKLWIKIRREFLGQE